MVARVRKDNPTLSIKPFGANLPNNYEALTPLEKCEALNKGSMIYWSSGEKPYYRKFLSTLNGIYVTTLIDDIPPARRAERVGYLTQKPFALLQQVSKASSDEGDMVLDPFCGCATACIVAELEDR